jgi:hypothetical protein
MTESNYAQPLQRSSIRITSQIIRNGDRVVDEDVSGQCGDDEDCKRDVLNFLRFPILYLHIFTNIVIL